MEELKQTIQKVFTLGGFTDFSVDVEPEGKRVSIFIHGIELNTFFPKLIWDMEHLFNLMARRRNLVNFAVDVNNYRRERERLLVELAKAAARKALVNKDNVDLPAMNAYERRLVHLELASRPDVKTESVGEGKERHVVVKLF